LKTKMSPFQKRVLWSRLLSKDFNRDITIPRSYITVRHDRRIFVYVLDKHTIGLTVKPCPEWDSICIFKEIGKAKKQNLDWLFSLSDKIRYFYHFQQPETHTVLTFGGRRMLITVTTKR